MVFPGHEATIRIDAYPGKMFKGHVKTVATVASQAEFFSSDIKVYQTMVSIDDNTLQDKLKPGMSAEVTITADETHHPVLVIPIQSVVGNVSMGADRKCLRSRLQRLSRRTRHRGRPVQRQTRRGQLRPGRGRQDRHQCPRPLLPEKSDMKAAIPSSRRGGDAEDGGKKGKKKDGKAPSSSRRHPGPAQATARPNSQANRSDRLGRLRLRPRHEAMTFEPGRLRLLPRPGWQAWPHGER